MSDWGKAPSLPKSIDQYPLNEQPAALDRAALEFCAADAFHPGIEMTWPMRRLSLYTKPFRIARATTAEPDYGTHLNVATALGPGGPLNGQFPGSLSRWMLLPWQIDTGGCLAGYDDRLIFDAPSFWPSRVPNNVLPHENYARAIDPLLPREERTNAFVARRSWFFPLNSPAQDWGKHLIQQFGTMGVLEAYPGVAADADMPAVIYVETLPGAKTAVPSGGAASVPGVTPEELSPEDLRARAAQFADEADRVAVRKMRFGR